MQRVFYSFMPEEEVYEGQKLRAFPARVENTKKHTLMCLGVLFKILLLYIIFILLVGFYMFL